MPTAKQAMYAALAGDSAITAVVGNQIYPDQALEGVVEPYLEFSVVSDIQKKGLRGPIGLRFVRFQIEGYCATRLQAETLEAALEALLDGFQNQSYGGLTVQASFIPEDEGAVDEDDNPRP